MAWGSGGGWKPNKASKKGGGGAWRDTRSQQSQPINAQNYDGGGVPSNFPGALENHPDWVSDEKPNGSCAAHPGGCKNSRVGSVVL